MLLWRSRQLVQSPSRTTPSLQLQISHRRFAIHPVQLTIQHSNRSVGRLFTPQMPQRMWKRAISWIFRGFAHLFHRFLGVLIALSGKTGTQLNGYQQISWKELDAAAGDYVVGFIVADLDGNTQAVYAPVTVK